MSAIKTSITIFVGCLFSQASTASADVLAGWITSNEVGSLTAQETAAGISGAVMDRGAGLDFFDSFDDVYDSSSWSTSTTFPGVPNEDYLSFVVNVESGFAADFTRLRLNVTPDDNGPDTMDLRSSADGFTSLLAQFDGLRSMDVQPTLLDLDFGGSPVAGVTGSVEFRLYGYGSGSLTDGVFGPQTFDSPLLVNGEAGGVHLEGSFAAVPEPATYASLLGLLMLGLVSFRTLRKRPSR